MQNPNTPVQPSSSKTAADLISPLLFTSPEERVASPIDLLVENAEFPSSPLKPSTSDAAARKNTNVDNIVYGGMVRPHQIIRQPKIYYEVKPRESSKNDKSNEIGSTSGKAKKKHKKKGSSFGYKKKKKSSRAKDGTEQNSGDDDGNKSTSEETQKVAPLLIRVCARNPDRTPSPMSDAASFLNDRSESPNAQVENQIVSQDARASNNAMNELGGITDGENTVDRETNGPTEAKKVPNVSEDSDSDEIEEIEVDNSTVPDFKRRIGEPPSLSLANARPTRTSARISRKIRSVAESDGDANPKELGVMQRNLRKRKHENNETSVPKNSVKRGRKDSEEKISDDESVAEEFSGKAKDFVPSQIDVLIGLLKKYGTLVTGVHPNDSIIKLEGSIKDNGKTVSKTAFCAKKYNEHDASNENYRKLNSAQIGKFVKNLCSAMNKKFDKKMRFVKDSDKPYRLVKLKEVFFPDEFMKKHWPHLFTTRTQNVASASKNSSDCAPSTSKQIGDSDKPVSRAEFVAFKKDVVKTITSLLKNMDKSIEERVENMEQKFNDFEEIFGAGSNETGSE